MDVHTHTQLLGPTSGCDAKNWKKRPVLWNLSTERMQTANNCAVIVTIGGPAIPPEERSFYNDHMLVYIESLHTVRGAPSEAAVPDAATPP